MKIFIAGCGRSGTTLIRDLMNCFEDTYVLVEGPYGEASYSRFESLPRPEANVVIKRTGEGWKTLASLPDDLELIYCVRHPFDTLTSTHPLTRHLRRFHITEGRWASEYHALAALRIAQPNRRILFLRYEDLVREPDATQERIADHLGLIPKRRFSENTDGIAILNRSIEKWHNNPDFSSYFESFPDYFRSLLLGFCDEFDYVLPPGYAPSKNDSVRANSFQYRFTVIIPLEFHRGQIEACLEGWAVKQMYARDQYEILAAGCRSSLSEEAISVIKAALRPHDKLLLYDSPHDISLCSYAAHEAKGEILIFTESHCLPRPDVLSIAEERMRAHPEWAGFSGHSLPVTHNRLSIIEADMYGADIRHGMTEHPWRKILDQFFAVRRREYLDAGGFLPEFGHFSEWLLAARMHHKEYHIGYAPDVQFWHYYIGDYEELIEFSNDFTRGEMKYKSEYLDDPCQDYFPLSNEWLYRFGWLTGWARRAFSLAWKARSKSILGLLNPLEIIYRIRLLSTWRMRAQYGIVPAASWASLKFQIALAALRLGIFLRIPRNLIRTIFLWLIDATIRLERIDFVQRWLAGLPADSPSSSASMKLTNWLPDTHPVNFNSLGFHPLEEWKGTKFRWSEPVAIVEICLPPGEYRFELDWLPIRSITNLFVYLDEKPLDISRTKNQATGTFTITSDQPARFSWTCEPWTKHKNDPRMLGVPVSAISWICVSNVKT